MELITVSGVIGAVLFVVYYMIGRAKADKVLSELSRPDHTEEVKEIATLTEQVKEAKIVYSDAKRAYEESVAPAPDDLAKQGIWARAPLLSPPVVVEIPVPKPAPLPSPQPRKPVQPDPIVIVSAPQAEVFETRVSKITSMVSNIISPIFPVKQVEPQHPQEVSNEIHPSGSGIVHNSLIGGPRSGG